MSKCKAVLDGNKITEIRVRTRVEHGTPEDEREKPKAPDEPQATSTTVQRPE
jgi:hypothetical protein